MIRGQSAPVGAAAIGEALAALRARWYIPVITLVIGAIVGIAMSGGKDDQSYWLTQVSVSNLSGNATLVDLGISAPNGPAPGDLVGDDIIDGVAAQTGLDPAFLRDAMVTSSNNAGIPTLVNLVYHPKPGSSDAQSQQLMADWFDEINKDREAYVKSLLDQAQGVVDLKDGLVKTKTYSDLEDRDKSRIKMLKGTLGSDVRILRKPVYVSVPATSKSKVVLGGAVAGGIFGLLLVIALALAGGILLTRRGLAARFSSPVVAEFGEGDRNAAFEQVRRWIESTESSQVVLVDATEGTHEDLITETAGKIPGLKAVGTIGETALAIPADTEVVLVLAEPGRTRSSDSEELQLELAQIRGLERSGLLLV